MSTNFRLTALARAAAISIAVVIPAISGAVTSAYAYDAFGGDPALVEQSAQSARYANPNDTPLAKATAQAKAAASASAYAANRSSVASDASKAVGSTDLVGQGGPQDDFAREIYHPGTGTDW